MGNDSCFREGSPSKHRVQHQQDGYTPEEIEADRRYLATHTPVPRMDYPSKQPTYSKIQDQDLLQRANSFSRKRKYTQAEERYLHLIQRNPNDADNHYHYGCQLFDTKKLSDAEKQFKICITLNPQHGKCHRKYSELLGFMGKVQLAQKHYQLAVQYDPQPDPVDNRFKQKWAQNPRQDYISSSNINPYATINSRPSPEPEEKLCIVCASNQITHSNKTCGHLCVCQNCSNLLQRKCPLCNQMGDFIRIYMA